MDLLELSRIDAGSTELHREEVDLRELIPRIAQRYGFGDVPIEIDQKVPDAGAARQAALRAHPRQPAGERPRARRRPDPGVADDAAAATRMVLGVDDAGPGVARGERSRIFERFARGSAARHRVGTGLGLALVAEHAQAHGGEAWVEDRPGGGARFMVSFPEVV